MGEMKLKEPRRQTLERQNILAVSEACQAIFRAGSVQSLDRMGRPGDMTDDSAEIPFQSFLRKARRDPKVYIHINLKSWWEAHISEEGIEGGLNRFRAVLRLTVWRHLYPTYPTRSWHSEDTSTRPILPAVDSLKTPLPDLPYPQLTVWRHL